VQRRKKEREGRPTPPGSGCLCDPALEQRCKFSRKQISKASERNLAAAKNLPTVRVTLDADVIIMLRNIFFQKEPSSKAEYKFFF
jgi:hypothetical protein